MTKLIELIEGGFLAQTLLVLIVWGVIGLLAATGRAIPDPILDAGFVIIGFYFRSVISQQSNKNAPQG